MKKVSLSFYKNENLTIEKIDKNLVRLNIRALGEFTMPLETLKKGINDLDDEGA